MADKEDKPGGKEEEAMSEAAERSFEANMKILVGNEIAHSNRVSTYAELALKEAIGFQQKANESYLTHRDAQLDETSKHLAALSKQLIENWEFRMDRLYGVFPEEAVGIGTMLRGFAEYLKTEGWTPPVKA